MSSNLAWTALHSTALAGRIEDAHEGEARFDIEHRSYVLSALIAAVGFLEAAVNELYQDASDGHPVTGDGYLAPLAGQTVEAMAVLWDGTDEGFKLKALEKWQFVLVFAGRRGSTRALPLTKMRISLSGSGTRLFTPNRKPSGPASQVKLSRVCGGNSMTIG